MEARILDDYGYRLLPRIWSAHMPDYLSAAAHIVAMIPLTIYHKRRFVIWKRWLVLHGICFILRAITIITTVLPKSNSFCAVAAVSGTPEENILLEALKMIAGQRMACGDLLFSGHTVHLTFMGLIFTRYGVGIFGKPEGVEYFVALCFMWSIVCMGYLTLIATHFHYSCDVVVGVLVTATLWTAYHDRLDNLSELRSGHPLRWLECHEPDKVSGGIRKNDPERNTLLMKQPA